MNIRDTAFPAQKIPLFKKNKEWKEECVDSIIGIETSGGLFGRANSRKDKMRIGEGLYNSEYDEDDLKYVTDPFKVEDGFPAKVQEFNIIKPKIDLLIGEESKRPANIRVIQTNDDAVTKLQEKKKALLLEYVQSQLEEKSQVDDQGNPITLPEIEKYMRYTYKSIAEETAYHTLKYLNEKLNIPNELLKGWKDGLTKNEEIYYVGALNGEPYMERVEPKNCDYDRNPDLEFIEDGDKFVRRMEMTAASIYDRHFDALEEKDLDKLLSYNDRSSGKNIGSAVNTKSIMYKEKISSSMFGEETSEGLLSVWHVVWRSYDEIGFLQIPDEAGGTRTIQVDRTYKPKEGEKIEWEWVDVIYEGYRAMEDLYWGIGPLDYQGTSIDSPVAKKLPYCGVKYGGTDSDSKALTLVMKPLQYMHIIIWYRLELTLARDKGKVLNMDITQIPKGLGITTEQWMHYISALGINFINPYDEGWNVPGREGGKASPFNQIEAVDLTMGNVVAEYVNLLVKIEDMIGEISGVSKARQGQIHERALVGNVQREVIQSSHITEPLFWTHNQVKKNVFTMLLNVAKNVWADQDKKKLHYILNDATRMFMEITDDFLYSDMDVFITDSTKENQDIESIKTLLQPAMQAGASLLEAAEIVSGDNMSQMKQKLADIEKRKEEMIAAQQEAEQQQAQIQADLSKEEMRITEEDSIRKAQTDIQVALIKAAEGKEEEGEDGFAEAKKLQMDLEKQKADIKLKKDSLAEDVRKNKKAELQKQQEIEIKKKVANKPVAASK